MFQNLVVSAVFLLALGYLVQRVFFKKKTCDSCGMEASKKR